MTREQAKERLNVIEFWANGGELYRYNRTLKQWVRYDIGDMDFTSKGETCYIPKDRHFEARKAFALGEKIEYRKEGEKEWRIWERNCAPSWGIEYEYRPKKKEWWKYASEETPILCYVWNNMETYDNNYGLIIKKRLNGPFVTTTGLEWKNAKYIRPSECFQKPE